MEEPASISCTAPGRRTSSGTAILGEDGETHLGTIKLYPSHSLGFEVKNQQGAPVPDVQFLCFQHGVLGYQRRSIRGEPGISPPAGTPIATTARSLLPGQYTLEDLPGTPVDVWARHESSLWTALYDLQPSVEGADPIEFALDLQESRMVEGTVLSPEGVPHGSGSGVSLLSDSDRTSFYQLADPAGRFAIVLPATGSWTIRAFDGSDRFASSDRLPVLGGERHLKLKLNPPSRILLRVTSDSGVTLPLVSCRLRVEGNAGPWMHRAPDEDGLIVLDGIVRETSVTVCAPGHAAANVGPLMVGSIPHPVECRLAAQVGIAGRVVFPEGSLVQVTISLHQAPALGERWISPSPAENGEFFDVLAYRPLGYEAQVSSSGEFSLPLPAFRRFYLALSRPSVKGAQLYGPFTTEAASTAPATLELLAPGSIRGSLSEEYPGGNAGRIIGASCGDSQLLLARTSAAGEFAFPALAAGDWQLRVCNASANSTRFLRHRSASQHLDPIRWDCRVLPGRETDVSIERPAQMPCLEGRIAFGGVSPSAWTAALHPPDARLHPLDRPLATCGADEDGRFRLSATKPGDHLLVLSTSFGLHIVQSVRLASGIVRWEASVEPHPMQVAGVPEWSPREERSLRWTGPSGVIVAQRIAPSPPGTMVLVRHAPPGENVLLSNPASPKGLMEDGWAEVGKFISSAIGEAALIRKQE